MTKKQKKVDGPAEKKMDGKTSIQDPPGLIARLGFFWMIPAFYNGNRRDLEEYDLIAAKSIYDSKIVGDKLERVWYEEEFRAKAAGKKPSFTRALIKAFGWSFLPGGLMQFAAEAIRTGTPLLFAQLLTYWQVDSTMSVQTAAYYAAGVILGNWIAAFCNHHGNLFCHQFGMKLRIATSSLMFRKVMVMDNGALGGTTVGKIVNILSNDLLRFDMALLFLHYVWIIPLQYAAILYLGYLQAGYSAFVGLAALLIIAIPIQSGLSRLIAKVRFRTAEKTDDRVKTMSEVINGIQVIKMYAWEIPFQKVISHKRSLELKQVRIATILKTVFLGFMMFTERTALFIAILVYILLGNTMSASVIYPLQQFISTASVKVTLILPLVLSFTAEMRVTLRRVEEFLAFEDRADLVASQPGAQLHFPRRKSERPVSALSYKFTAEDFLTPSNGFIPYDKKFNRSVSLLDDVAVDVRDVSASWTDDPNFQALKNITLRIRKGKLCAVIGSVGCGKSSFLQLLLKELSASSGSVSTYGSLSYACQEAWLFPATVRDNILFGLPYIASKYRTVCKVCALEKDFKQFPFSDQTLVGERGVSLSGGQRARINLARAVYREADIYLLDDPLSAVDANVGRQLFEGCINGYLRGKTRVLVTHQIHFLKAADYIIILNEGKIENMGTYQELMKSGRELSRFISEDKDKDSASLSAKSDDKANAVKRRVSRVSEAEEQPEFKAQVIAAEERQSGALRLEVIAAYFLSGNSVCYVLFAVGVILAATAAAGAADYWVSNWTNEMARHEAAGGSDTDGGLDEQVGRFTTRQYLIVHGSIVAVLIVFVNVRVLPFVQLCIASSRKLHNKMFSVMLRGIMRFFDTSSSGRILNRFTKDIGAVDEILPRTLLDVFQIYSTLAAILTLNAIALYWTLIPSAVLIAIFAILVKIYLNAAQSIKRLEGTTKSPVFGLVTSSLNGIATIRSCGAQKKLIEDFDRHQNLHTAAWNGFLGGGSTFGFYLDTLCCIYLATVIFVFLYIDFGGAIEIGSVGLAVTQSLTLTMMLQHGARMLVEFLAQLTSVERVLEYSRIDTETNLFEGQVSTPTLWPSQGRIVFQNVNMRYAPEEAPILKNLNITIESGWKVGVVGRTGAGKSSLISALFKFAFLDGTVTIDGLDTSLIARQDLRTKISIIPQEPVLFSATIRYNLDPFNVYSDDDLWRALEQVDMKSAIPSLDFLVTEGGSNFSVGQRQLMCLARAVLRSNKILIMDEATANVDPETDNFIQKTIRSKFASCTVLTIAHRLNTIMDSDRVLVMDSGEVAEFDYPYHLLADPNSRLSSMVRETGDSNMARLFQIAKDAYFQSNLKENAT
ncbi:ATP-binding cassette sub-family C member 4-like [Leguminivora glycinivorella]|uniref:ATP-binding cassette sub-family C member 4-like n=1 Tax=Leguminivora glycinivorella TaxID=1035111 RepID=UPI00200CDCA5|nr:ATP-binding cassette sub-family C member 4-like [Leguminivora glycinivorella]